MAAQDVPALAAGRSQAQGVLLRYEHRAPLLTIATARPALLVSQPGMTAVRLRVTLRTMITELRRPAWPPRSQA
jgi:hypothetical protein